MKICKKCNLEKDYSMFGNRIKEKDGKSRYCKECLSEEGKLNYLKNKDKKGDYYKINSKRYRENNPEKCKEYDLEYYINNISRRKEYDKKYKFENKDKIKLYDENNIDKKREYHRAYAEDKRNNDINYRIRMLIGVRINKELNEINSKKTKSTIYYLGCNIDEYVLYLESKFNNIMSWDNYGKDKYWEIDHIIPICKFDLSNEDEIKKCFHYTNTQPLTITENRIKSGKYESK